MWKTPATTLVGSLFLLPKRTLTAAVLLAGGATAQCAFQVSRPASLPGCSGRVNVIRQWDPDGTGPLPAVTVVGGDFRFAGDIESRGLAAFDPLSNSWSALGPTANRSIAAMTVLQNGSLVAGGAVNNSGSVETWDGTTWRSLVSTANERVLALAVMPNGDLVAGGFFTSIDGVSANRIARWNGTNWSPLGAGLDGGVWALCVDPNGDLLVGGEFVQAGGAPALRLARWDGSNWSSLASTDSTVRTIAYRSNGDLVVGGFFASVNGVTAAGIARWDGVQWSGLGNGVGSLVTTVLPLPNGHLAVGGHRFNTAQVALTGVALWDGASWLAPTDPLGGVPPLVDIQCVAAGSGGEILVGGLFDWAGSLTAANLVKWDGLAWRRVSGGYYIGAHCITAEPGDGFAVGLEFRGVGTVDTANVVRHRAGTWSAVGNGVPGKPKRIASLPNDGLVVVSQNSASTFDVYQWDGSAWTQRVGALTVQPVVQAMPDGSFVLGGTFSSLGGVPASNIARWDGSTWQPLGTGTDARVQALALLPDGSLVAGGAFLTAGGVPVRSTAKWNGSAWSFIPAVGNNLAVSGLSVGAGGDLYATAFGGLLTYRWTGSAWAQLGPVNSQSSGTLVLPDGSAIRVGTSLTRWNGVAWESLSNLTTSTTSGVAVLSNGDVVVIGPTATPAIQFSYFTRLTAPCRAIASPAGAGCLGASLQVGNRAWTGGSCRARGEGLGAAQLAIVATGFQPAAVGLDTLLPQGVAGCTLQVVEDSGLTQIVVANGGLAECSLAIPRDPVLVGVAFRQQMVPLQFDAQGGITAITSTNAIDHVVGSY